MRSSCIRTRRVTRNREEKEIHIVESTRLVATAASFSTNRLCRPRRRRIARFRWNSEDDCCSSPSSCFDKDRAIWVQKKKKTRSVGLGSTDRLFRKISQIPLRSSKNYRSRLVVFEWSLNGRQSSGERRHIRRLRTDGFDENVPSIVGLYVEFVPRGAV